MKTQTSLNAVQMRAHIEIQSESVSSVETTMACKVSHVAGQCTYARADKPIKCLYGCDALLQDRKNIIIKQETRPKPKCTILQILLFFIIIVVVVLY